jgi:ribonuclease Z
VSLRELIVLGTASQAPTRERNHNGYLLRWDDEGILFDPGEGTQRQLIHAGISVSAITRVCITHFHGDHCLGLAGVLQRRSLDGVMHPLDVYFPASGVEYFERLRWASIYNDRSPIRAHAVDAEGIVAQTSSLTLAARRLDHRVETFGWRLVEQTRRHMLPERLASFGIEGSDIGRLQREGALTIAGRRVLLDEVSEVRPGQVFAFIMDTRLCAGAAELAAGADLLVCEATFLERDADLARAYAHLTAQQAATLAYDAGVRQLVLTHLSQRYGNGDQHAAEANAVFPGAVVAKDFDRFRLSTRRVGP